MLKQLREQRAKLVAAMRTHNDAMGDTPSDDQSAEWTRMDGELLKLDENIARWERLEAAAEQQARAQEPEPADSPMSRLGEYSLLRVARAALANRAVDGLEGEVSQEIGQRVGRQAKFTAFVPWGIPARVGEQRTLTTTAGAGATQTITRTQDLIELLRARMLLTRLGARVLNDLNGSIKVPKLTVGHTAGWVTEGNAASESLPEVGAVNLVPKTLSAWSEYSRQLIAQSSLAVEDMLRDDLIRCLATSMDQAGFKGSGASGQPEGIVTNSAVPTVPLGTNGGAPTLAAIAAMNGVLSKNNVVDGVRNFVTTPAGMATLQTTETFSTSGRAIWSDDGRVMGHAAYDTNQLSSTRTKGSGTDLSEAVMGVFEHLLWGMWGAIDLLVDPYSRATHGEVRLVGHVECDFGVRHPGAFAKIVDMITVTLP